MPPDSTLAAPLQEAYSGCPLCASPTTHVGTADCRQHVLWHEPLPPTIEWMRCDACGHVHTRHYWTQAGLAEVFRNAHRNQVADASLEQRRYTWKPVVQNAIHALGGYARVFDDATPPVWLDVGCGNGLVQMIASEFGFAAIGVDMREQAVHALTALGYRAVCANFLDVRMDRPALVISMLDVLEHMPWPAKALQHARELMPAGGCLVVALPNMHASTWKQMDADNSNPYWLELEHHHNFSRPRLVRLLADHGFEVALFDIPQRYIAGMELYAIRRS
jgi:SAM-dependent methyltransferase